MDWYLICLHYISSHTALAGGNHAEALAERHVVITFEPIRIRP
jgi:hypothetical protein